MVEPTASIATLTGWLETANEIRVGDLVEVKCQCAGGLEPRCAGRAREILLHNCFTCASTAARARAQRFGKTVLRKQSITLEDLELVVSLALPPSGDRSAEHGRILVPQGHGPLLHVELHRARLPAAERKGRLVRPRRHTRADSAPRRPASLLRALAWAPRSRHNRPSQSRQSCARRGRPRPWWPHRATLPPCMRWQMPQGELSSRCCR